MFKCPFCEFENEEGALFCEQCKSDLGAERQAPAAQHAAFGAPHSVGAAMPAASVSEVASPMAAVAVAEAAVSEGVRVAQVDAGVAAMAEMPIAVAVPLPEAPPVTVAPELPTAGMAEAAVVGPVDASSSRPATAPDISLPSVSSAEAAPALAAPLDRLPKDAKPKLVVVRGQRMSVEYPLYDGDNYLGRADEKAVDIDLEDQEPPDRIWSSRQHALINYDNGQLTLEDLGSTNGTFVNRMRVHPGQKRPLQVNDVIQIGTVHLKVTI
jgi:hypothetical protein